MQILMVQTRENDAISYMTYDKIRRFINLACVKISKAVFADAYVYAGNTHTQSGEKVYMQTHIHKDTNTHEGFVQYPEKNKNK